MACASSGPIASASSTPRQTSTSTPRSLRRSPSGAASGSCRSRVRSASRCWKLPSRSASASRRSCRSGTRPTSRATICCSTGRTTPRPTSPCLYLESFGNPTKFNRLARRFSRHKPIVAVKSGRSEAGQRAASSHTAALATDDILTDTLFRQAGIIRVDTLAQMFDVTRVLVHQPLPAGRRVAIVGNSGGPGILAADACSSAGLVVPELSHVDAHRPDRSARPARRCAQPGRSARECGGRGVRAGPACGARRRIGRRRHRDLHRSDDQRAGGDRRGGSPRRVQHTGQDDVGLLPRPRPPAGDRARDDAERRRAV